MDSIPPPPIHCSISPSPTRIPVPLSSTNITPRRPSLTPSSPSPSNSPTLSKSSIPLPAKQPSPPAVFLPPPPQLPPALVIDVPTSPPPIELIQEEEDEVKPSTTPTTYLEDLHAEEEELEHMAARIASVHTPSVGFTSSIGTSLRRRVTAATTSSKKERNESVVSVNSNSTEEEGDEETKEAIRLMEDEEVARFLERVSKQITEVRASVPRSSIALPEPSSFVTTEGKTNWIAFGKAYALSLAHIYTPSSLLAPPPYTSFSVTVAKNHAERLYVITPISFWENLLEGSLSRIYRWDPRERTWLYASIYSILWFFDLLPFFPPFAFLLYLLKSIFFPPTIEELLAKSKSRKERALEAANFSKSFNSLSSSKIGLGLAVQSAKGLFSGILPEKEKGALVRGLGGATSLASGIVAPGKVSLAETEAVQATTVVSPEKEASLYKLLKEIVVVLGPEGQELMAQASDLSEKVKNLITHPDHPAINGVCLRLTIICLTLFFCPTWILIKSAWAYLGFEFFVLWKLREDYPEWRRALNPIWWLLLDAPTDAEYATYILRKRSLESKPLRGAKTLRRLSRTARTPSPSPTPTPSLSNISTASTTLDKDIGITSATAGRMPEGLSPVVKKERRLSASSLLSAANALGNRLHSRAPSITDEEVLGSHFALLKAIPGTLTITATKVQFVPSVRISSLKFGKSSSSSASSSSTVTSDTASETSSFRSVDPDHDGLLMNILLEELDGIKKKSMLGFEGLEIVVKEGKSFSLSNVSRRDHAFNLLFSNSKL